MNNSGGVILAINFSSDVNPNGPVPAQDHLWNTLLTEHCGRKIGRNEDTIFAKFDDARSAVTCALAIQWRFTSNDEMVSAGDQIYCRVSVNHRPIGIAANPPDLDEIDDVYKLLAVADLRGISVSRTVFDEVRRNLKVEFDTSRPIEQCGYLCQNIRGNLDRLDLLQASAVRILPTAITNALAGLH